MQCCLWLSIMVGSSHWVKILKLLNLCTLRSLAEFNNFLPYIYIYIYISQFNNSNTWLKSFSKVQRPRAFSIFKFSQLFFSPPCTIESHLSGSSIGPIKTRCISNVWTRYRLKLSRKLKTSSVTVSLLSRP